MWAADSLITMPPAAALPALLQPVAATLAPRCARLCTLRFAGWSPATAGRLAMDEPNLQTVPKPRDYKVLLSQVRNILTG